MTDEKPNHYTLATSDIMAEIFASAFRTDHSHIIIEGYPRNDILLSENIANIYSNEELRINKLILLNLSIILIISTMLTHSPITPKIPQYSFRYNWELPHKTHDKWL